MRTEPCGAWSSFFGWGGAVPDCLSRKSLAVIAAAVVAAGVLAYANAPGNGATNFDDRWQVEANALVKAPVTAANLARIFFAPYHGEYQPVKLASYLADDRTYRALGVDVTFGMHLTNVVIHLANSILVAVIAMVAVRDLGKGELRERGALFVGFFAGAYFALHPVHVESVAWLSSRRDVLSFFFMGLAFLVFRHAATFGSRAAAALSVALFALALGAKATVICLPLVAFAYWALISWRGGRLAAAAVGGFFAVAAVYAAGSLYIIGAEGHVAGPAGGSYYLHVLTVIRTFPFYMRLMLFPVGLSAAYSIGAASGFFEPAVWWGLAMILGQLAMVFFVRVKMVRFLVLWYLFSLAPVLQILPMAVPAFAADRYAYIPSVPFAIAPAIILWQARRALLERRATAVASVLIAAGVVYAGVLGVATSSRNRVWRSSETLWRDVLAKDGANRFALVNLGEFYSERGDIKQARHLFVRAAKIDPGFLLSYFNLGLTYEKSGDLSEAARYYARGLETPSSLTARATAETRARAAYGLARIRFAERRYLSSRRYADTAVALDGDLEGPAACYVAADKAIKECRALADGLVQTGDALAGSDPEKAAGLYAKAAEEALEYGVPGTRLARLYLKLGRYQEALDRFAAASEIVEPRADFEYDYGLAALHLSRYDVAAEHLSKAIVIEPTLEKAKVKLAVARAYLGEPAQALLMLQDILARDPANAEARANYEAIRVFLVRAVEKSSDASK